MKSIAFLGTARRELAGFPQAARRETGFQLWSVQQGDAPDDFKPMPVIGPGAYEIRVHEGGAFRVIYVAKFPEAVYVLHCFEKRTRATSDLDVEVARTRYRSMLAQRGND